MYLFKASQKIVLLLILYSVQGQYRFTFQQALQKAASNNPELKTESIRLGYADAEILTAKVRPNPLLNNQFLELMDRSASTNPDQPLSSANRQVWYQLTKPMMLGNQRQHRIDLALQNKKISILCVEEKRRQIYHEVGIRWLNLWFHKVELQNLVEAKENVDTLVEINAERLRKGEIPPIEGLRTQLLAEQYELHLMNIRQDYAGDVNDLKTYLNIEDTLDVDVRMTIQVLELPETIDSLTQYALANRPDMLMLKEQLGWSKKNVTLQRSMRYPYMELGLIYNPQNGIVYGGTFATLSMPLFNRNQGSIHAASIQVNETSALIGFHQGRIKNEVKKAQQTYTINRKIMEQFQTILLDSRLLLKTVSESYLKGETSVFDYLEAQRSFLSTQELYYEAMFNYRKSYLELLYVTGYINKI